MILTNNEDNTLILLGPGLPMYSFLQIVQPLVGYLGYLCKAPTHCIRMISLSRHTHQCLHSDVNKCFSSRNEKWEVCLQPYCRTTYEISQASDWASGSSRPIRSLRYMVTCTKILPCVSRLIFQVFRPALSFHTSIMN